MGEAKTAISAAATSALSRVSSAADGSNRLAACSTQVHGQLGLGLAADSAADRVRRPRGRRGSGTRASGSRLLRQSALPLPPAWTSWRWAESTGRSGLHDRRQAGRDLMRRERGRGECVIRAAGRGMVPAAALAQDGQHALAEPVRLLQVRVPGEDELRDAELGVLLDPLGDLGVAADQGGAGAAAHQADAGPQVRARSRGRPASRRAAPASAAALRIRCSASPACTWRSSPRRGRSISRWPAARPGAGVTGDTCRRMP